MFCGTELGDPRDAPRDDQVVPELRASAPPQSDRYATCMSRSTFAGVVAGAAGFVVAVIGLTRLDATVHGSYTNASDAAKSADVVYATSVDGKGLVIVGLALIAIGGALSLRSQ